MSQIAEQVHSKFKVFAGQLQQDKTIGPLADEIERFVSSTAIAPKSIGVEYLESAQRLIITLGYRDDEPGYGVKINCVSLGKIDSFASDFSALESAMAGASQTQRNIICHELYVTEDHDLLMIFMTHQAQG
ncbi:MAG: hypothetical protein AB1631_29295 [Acidobacteriota bacterium]